MKRKRKSGRLLGRFFKRGRSPREARKAEHTNAGSSRRTRKTSLRRPRLPRWLRRWRTAVASWKLWRSPRFQWFLTGARPEPRPASIGTVEDPEPGKLGICCSGGGIRSAAFNLGALQALQSRRTLHEAKYLAAVSGGSYIAAGFAMVAKVDDPEDSDPDLVNDDAPPFHPGSPEEQYLRNRSSYMAPDGLGKLFLGFRVLMGLVFNLFFLGLPMFAVGAVLAAAVYRPGYEDLLGDDGSCDASGRGGGCGPVADVPGWAWLALGAVAALVVALGVLSLLWRFKRDGNRRAVETWATRLILVTVAAAVVLIAVPVLVDALFGQRNEAKTTTEAASSPDLLAPAGGSLAALLVAVLLQLRTRFGDSAALLKESQERWKALRSLPAKARRAFVYLAGAVAGPAILLGFTVYGAAVTLSDSSSARMLVVAGGAFALFGALYAVADLNTWSLHPFYRRRLCTAFALKRIRGGRGTAEARERDYGRLVPLSRSAVAPKPSRKRWPTLLVCAAANVSDPGATPPGRGVTSFVFSPSEIGGPLVGKSPTSRYEQALGRNRERDITLPAAVAMSGAALSPSMGKMTRRPYTFLLALANVRLGVWVPNPRHLGRWSRREPLGRVRRRLHPGSRKARDVVRMPRPSYLLRELLGRNRLDAKFLYVSDGGHYDNLGLVELLRRGCTEVYCFDAGGGSSAKELGDAIALARSELRVEISIRPDKLDEKGDPPVADQDCVTGTIKFPDVEQEGTLVYARTVMTKDLPWDVRAFREVDPVFPHHSTVDQLFTDQKFEAYRALGHVAGEHAHSAMTVAERVAVTKRTGRFNPQDKRASVKADVRNADDR